MPFRIYLKLTKKKKPNILNTNFELEINKSYDAPDSKQQKLNNIYGLTTVLTKKIIRYRIEVRLVSF